MVESPADRSSVAPMLPLQEDVLLPDGQTHGKALISKISLHIDSDPSLRVVETFFRVDTDGVRNFHDTAVRTLQRAALLPSCIL